MTLPSSIRRESHPHEWLGRLKAPKFQRPCALPSGFMFKTTTVPAAANPTSGLIFLRTMALAPENATWRLVLQGVQAAAEFVLIVVWAPAALLGAFAALGSHGHETLVWAIVETPVYVLSGALLYLAALALQRTGSPLFLIRILGGVAAPALALLVGLHSFYHLWYLQPYPLLVPLIFLAIVILCALAYGILFLPRHFKAGAAPRLHIHWAVVALLVPFAPNLILYAVNPASRAPLFAFGKPTIRLSGEVIFAVWTPGTDPLTVEPFAMHVPPRAGGILIVPDPPPPSATSSNLNEQEVQRLRSAGITGHIQVSGMSALTNTGRLVLIMSRQLDAPFQFFAPVEGASVIYLQTSAGWQKLLPEAGESKSRVRMYVPDGKPNTTGFEFDSGDGSPWHQEPRYLW